MAKVLPSTYEVPTIVGNFVEDGMDPITPQDGLTPRELVAVSQPGSATSSVQGHDVPLLGDGLMNDVNVDLKSSATTDDAMSVSGKENETDENSGELGSKSHESSSMTSPKLSDSAVEIREEKYVPLRFAQSKIKKILSDWTVMKMEYVKNIENLQSQYKKAEEEDQAYMKSFVVQYSKRYKKLRHRLKMKLKKKEFEIQKLNRSMQILQGADASTLPPVEEIPDTASLMSESSENGGELFTMKTFDRRTFVEVNTQTAPISFTVGGDSIQDDEMSRHDGRELRNIREANELLNDEVDTLKKNVSDIGEYYEKKLKEKQLEQEELRGQLHDLESFKQKVIELEENDDEDEVDALLNQSMNEIKEGTKEKAKEKVAKLERTLTKSNIDLEAIQAKSLQKENSLRNTMSQQNETIKSLQAQILKLTTDQKVDDEPEETIPDGEGDAAVEQLKKRLESAQSKMKALMNQKSVLVSSINNYKKDLETQVASAAEQKKELEENLQMVARLKTQLSQQEELLENKDQTLERMEIAIKKLKRATMAAPQTAGGADAKREVKKLKTLLLEKEQTLATTARKVQAAEQKVKAALEEQKKADAKVQKAESRAEKKISDMKEAQDLQISKIEASVEKKIERALSKKSKELEKFQKHHEVFKSKITKLAGELQKTIKKKEKAEQMLEKVELHAARHEKIVEKLKGQILEDAHFKTDYKKAVKDLNTFKKEYDEMDEQLQEAAGKARRYYNLLEDAKGKIRVYCRCRPFNDKDPEPHENCIGYVDDMTMKILSKNRQFRFNRVFGPDSSQDEVFKDTKDLLVNCMDGYNVCVFAYGQTGTGKTWTITGKPGKEAGIVPKAMAQTFQLAAKRSKMYDVTLEVQMIELYMDEFCDLLHKEKKKYHDKLRETVSSKSGKLEVKKDASGNVLITNSCIIKCDSVEEMEAVYEAGQGNRHTRATGMNADSSRSHLVFVIHVRSVNKSSGDQLVGKLTLVDLAGSENRKKTGLTDKVALAEAQSINMSLLHLGEVINSLSEGKKHVPYRASKLTRLLQDSLGGNAKTLMIVAIGPSTYNENETMNSLKYAERAKKIKNEVSKKVETKAVKHAQERSEQLTIYLQQLQQSGVKLPPGADDLLTKIVEEG